MRGGKYDPTPSPRRAERAPRYNTARMNRHDDPEDGALADRCLTGGLPEFGTAYGGSFRRIVQTPGGISIFYDVGPGPGLAAQHRHERQSASAGRASASGMATRAATGRATRSSIDVTNFSPKTDYRGSRENLHLVERWTRTGPKYARVSR